MDHADQPVVDGDGCAGVARLSADLVDDGAGLLARPPCHAARIARRPAELAGDVAEHRIGADAVDLESLDVVDRLHLLRVELDHRVVEGVIAGDHRAEHPGGLGTFGGHAFARSAAVR